MSKKITTIHESQTPSSNTGLIGERDWIAGRLDWLQGSFKRIRCAQLGTVAQQLAEALGDEWAVKAGGGETHGVHYDNAAATGSGARLCWTEEDGQEWCRAWLSLPGKALARLTPEQILHMGRNLLFVHGFRATRYDAALDDYAKRVTPVEVEAACDSGAMHGAQKFRYIKEGKGKHRSHTLYMGSRKSDKFIRCYDKEEESKGKIAAIRWEVEFHDDLAHAAFQYLCESGIHSDGAMLGSILVAQVVGAIDFTDPLSGRRTAEQTRLPWWQSLCEDAQNRVKITVSKIVSTVEEKLIWIHKQVAPAMAQLYEAGPMIFSLLVKQIRQQGRRRLTKLHHAQVVAFKGRAADPDIALGMIGLSFSQGAC